MPSTSAPPTHPRRNPSPASPPSRPLRPLAFALLTLAVGGLFLLELIIGSVRIPPGDVIAFLLGREPALASWTVILEDIRLPRALTALLAGAALGAAGLQLQTLFRNPLAGPWALGITAGAQFGVAVVVATGNLVGVTALAWLGVLGDLGIVVGAFLGAGGVALIIASVSRHVSTLTLLVLGLMLGFLAQGLVSVVLHFTSETQARVFASWNDGSFGGVVWSDFRLFLPLILTGLAAALAMVKPLNALLLGEAYASTLGLPVERVRLLVLTCAVLLAAPVTAYCGPILFVGMIVPHLARGVFRTSDHRTLMPASILMGALLGLSADLLVHLPWERHLLHLNAVTAVLGTPVVMAVVLRNRQMRSMDL